MDVVEFIVSIIIGLIVSLISNIIISKSEKVPSKYKIPKNKTAILILFFILGVIITSAAYSSVLVQTPSLSGMPKDLAISTLNGVGLQSNFEEQYNETVMKGVIISQDTPAGLIVKKGTKINFVVSKGSSLGSVSVNSEPSGARVYVDRADKGITPITIPEISAGTHEIKIIKEGYEILSKSISVSGGSPSYLSVSLNEASTPTPTATPSNTPTITSTSVPTITSTPTTTIASSPPITLKYSDFDTLDNVCTYENNSCGWATAPGKAIIYGSMTKSGIKVPEGANKLKVIISIPCNGWGEGLSGPDGSAARIIVDGVSKEENIDSSMKFHHGGYYKYESCDSFINIFDVGEKNEITLKIEMVGAHLDFQQAQLVFS